MADSFPEIVTGQTDPPPPPLRLRTSSQPKSLCVCHEKLTKSPISAFCLGYMTSALFFTAFFSIIMFFPTRVLQCNVTFFVESISVSPSSSAATWHVDFLVSHPSSRCLVYYDADGVYAKLGGVSNAAVLETSNTRRSRGHTSFSVDLATEGNQTDTPRILDLELKLSATKKQLFVEGDDYGHLYITCQNLVLGYEKIKCHSSFKKLLKLKELNSPFWVSLYFAQVIEIFWGIKQCLSFKFFFIKIIIFYFSIIL